MTTGAREDGRGRTLSLLAWAAIATAVLLRLLFLARKPFWSDEAWVALLAQGPTGDLLATRSPTPPGFLLIVKGCTYLPWLDPEVAYRLPLIAAGIATVLLLPRLARALGASRDTALVALLLAAALPALVHYSRELKHYGLDALLATAFPLAALRFFPPRGGADLAPHGRGTRALPALLAAAAPWLAYGSVFPVGATLGWGWIQAFRSRLPGRRAWWAVASLAFACSLVVLYYFFLRRQAGNPNLQSHWRHPIQSLQEMGPVFGLGAALLRYLEVSFSYVFTGFSPAAGALAAVGLALWPREGRGTLAILAGAAAVAACAAAVTGRYVIVMGRFLLFAAPLLILMVAGGLTGISRLAAGRLAPRLARAAPLAAAAALCAFWSFRAIEQRVHPERATWPIAFRYDNLIDVPGLIARAVERRAPGEAVLVAARISRPFRLYARGRLGDAEVVRSPGDFDDPAGTTAAWNRVPRWLAGVPGRGWILLAAGDESRRLREAVAAAGFTVVSRWASRGAVLLEVVREPRP